jgi:hypothetical protein
MVIAFENLGTTSEQYINVSSYNQMLLVVEATS